MEDLEIILGEAYLKVKSELNLELRKSKLFIYSEKDWFELCNYKNIEKNKNGIYLPKEYSAIVYGGSDFLIPEIFHNYFGHGLFLENSKLGGEILKNSSEENIEEFIKKIKKVNEENLGLGKNIYEDYEGFALWIEEMLCLKTRNYDVWKRKEKKLSDEERELLRTFKNSYYALTKFGFLAKMGFIIKYNKFDLLEYLKNFYGTEFNKIKIILSSERIKYESTLDKKINLFIFSHNRSAEIDNGWIKILEFNISDVEKGICSIPVEKRNELQQIINNLHLLFGEKNYLEKIKNVCFSNKTQTF
ncbi:MAG: hypothetical protein QXU20_02020 [Candidatus Woesearchaeota archaeon]